MGETNFDDAPRIVNRVKLLVRPGCKEPSLGMTCVGEKSRISPKEKLSGRLAVVSVAQVEVKENRVFARLLPQLGDGLFSLGDVRRNEVNLRVVVQEGLNFGCVICGK